MKTDKLALACIPFLLVCIVSYIVVFCKQYSQLDDHTNRLVIISTRLALFLPLYAILIYISLVIPVIYVAMEVPLALIEGYTFYTFFVLIVTNLGGPSETVRYLGESPKKLIFWCCCPLDKKRFYDKATWNVFHFLVTRVVVVFLSVICYYIESATGRKAFKVLYLIFSLVAFVQLIYGVASVVNLYEDVYAQTTNLNGVLKVLLLKMSVGLITVEGIVVELINAFGANWYSGNSDYSAEDQLQRNYCALVLIEFTVMAFVFYFAYGRKVTAPNTAYPEYISKRNNLGRNDKPTVGWFLCEVLRIPDAMGHLTVEEEEKLLSLGEPLLPAL